MTCYIERLSSPKEQGVLLECMCVPKDIVSGNALDIVIRAKEKNEHKSLATMEKKKSKREELRQKVAVVLTKGINPSSWNVDDLKNMAKWFKLPSDPALPTRREELIERYEQTKLRTMTGTILPDVALMTADSIPALQDLTNPMAIGIASVMNPMTLSLASAIDAPVLAPALVLAPSVAAEVAPNVASDVAPAVNAGVTLSVASGAKLSATSKEKKNKQ
jgi:hypothetical protein